MPFAVLLYHRVNPFQDPFSSAIPPAAFDAQMRYLARRFRVVPLGEVVTAIRQGREVEPWSIAVTFDDGYQNNYLYAHPILRKYNLRATVFVPTAYVESGRVLWNDRLARAIKRTEKKGVVFDSPSGRESFPLLSASDRVNAFVALTDALKTYAESRKQEALEVLLGQLEDRSGESEPTMLSWGQLRTMSEEGWDVGSHTVNHVILTKVSDEDARAELNCSKATLEKELQRPVRLFAYPNGKAPDFNRSVKNLVQDAGYEGALTTVDGINGPDVDPFEIRRRSPWEEHLPIFASQMQRLFWRAYRDRRDIFFRAKRRLA